MPDSMFNDRFKISQEECAISLLHNITAEKFHYSNATIIVERLEEKNVVVDTYELTINNEGLPSIKIQKSLSIDNFKDSLSTSDYYVSTAYAYPSELKPLDAMAKEQLLKLDKTISGWGFSHGQKPSLFNPSSNFGVGDPTESFMWARSLLVESFGIRFEKLIPHRVDGMEESQFTRHVKNNNKCTIL